MIQANVIDWSSQIIRQVDYFIQNITLSLLNKLTPRSYASLGQQMWNEDNLYEKWKDQEHC